jgi:hypothetical protein
VCSAGIDWHAPSIRRTAGVRKTTTHKRPACAPALRYYKDLRDEFNPRAVSPPMRHPRNPC